MRSRSRRHRGSDAGTATDPDGSPVGAEEGESGAEDPGDEAACPPTLRPTLDPRWMRFLCHPNQQTNQCLSLPKKVSVLVAQNDHQFSPSLHHFDQNFLQAHR